MRLTPTGPRWREPRWLTCRDGEGGGPVTQSLPGPAIGRRAPGSASASSALELFYDLVFAFTITQVSHLLIANLSWEGAVQGVILLLGAWWSWNYTTWFTDELDGDTVPVRLLMFSLMALSLLMAIAIPQAFGGRGLLFAGTYVAIQVARHGFLAFVAAGRGTPERERAVHITIWFLGAAVFWIGGAFAGGQARIALWIVALAIDYGAPFAYYRVPGRPRLGGEAWRVNPAHFADRFASFVILTLGEAIAITGATMTAFALTFSRGIAFVIAFLGSAAFWWLYFSRARDAAALLDRAGDQTSVARDAFTYGHVALVGAILLVAVGDEFVLRHPLEALSRAELLPVVLGPVLFLLAEVVIAWRIVGTIAWPRVAAAVTILAAGVFADRLEWPAVAVSAAILVPLAAVVMAAIRGEPAVRDGVPA